MIKKLIVTGMVLMLALSLAFTDQLVKRPKDRIIETKEYKDDYFAFANYLEFNGSADDVYGFGRKLVFSGSTNNSLFGCFDVMTINGQVKNNFMGAGRTVNINGKIDGSVLLMGQDVVIEKDAVINGTLYVMGQSLEIKGTLNSDLYMMGANLDINGKINGNVTANIGEIILGNNALITGNLKYRSEEERNIDKSRVKGVIDFKKEINHFKKDFKKHNEGKSAFFAKTAGMSIVGTIIMLMGGLLILLFPVMRKTETIVTDKNFFLYTVWGLIPFFIYPVLIIILFVLMVTIPLAFMVLLLGLPLLFLTQITGITMTGKYLFKLLKFTKENRFLYFMFGLIPYLVLSLIPFINILSFMFFASTGWGLLLEGIFNKKFSEA